MQHEESNKSAVETEKQTTVDCVLCGKREIHRNDWNDHIRGHRHESKLKTQNVEQLEKDEANNVSCICCNRNFTDPSFYRIHLGTKTHRRNMKRLDGKNIVQTDSVPITPTVSRLVKKGRKLGINEGDGLPEIIRKKYKTRNVKTDDLEYKGYIYTLAAFLSMRLALNQKVVDFMISVNDKDWGAFGDVVIRVIRKDRTILYAIQCKKFNQSVKQINCIEETKLNIKKQYDYIATLKNNGKDYSLTKFVIFTAYSTSSNFRKTFTLSSEVLNKWKTNTDTDTNTDTYIDNDGTVELKPLTTKNDVNVTSDPENVFCFVLADKVKCQLPYVFLYTGQKVFPFMINQLLKSKFDNNPDISKDYLKYVEQWGDGKLGGNYKLRKADVILKVGEILLNPFVVSPKKIQSQHDCFDIWNSVVDAVDLTVVKNNKFIISKICQPLNKKIEDTLSTNIDSVTKSVNLNPGGVSILNTISEPIKSYLFEVVQDKPHTEIPLHLIYNVFWKAEKIPLLLSTEDREECKGLILDVITFLKQMGIRKKYLLKTADFNLNHFKTQLKVFANLEDIKYLVNLDEIKIRVSESFGLSLSTINLTDPFFFKSVTPNMFLDLSLGRYSLKAGNRKNQNANDDLKIILSDEVKEELENSLMYQRPDLSRMNSCTSYINNKLRGIDPRLF